MKFSRSIATQSLDLPVQDNKIVSRHRKYLLRQQQHATMRNYVATKVNIVATKVEKNHRKNVTTKLKR